MIDLDNKGCCHYRVFGYEVHTENDLKTHKNGVLDHLFWHCTHQRDLLALSWVWNFKFYNAENNN